VSPLSHIDTWIFDLDQTLYPHEAGIMARVEARMRDFVVRRTGLGPDAAFDLQKHYWETYGTTLNGLMTHHNVEPYEFFDDVHNVPLDGLEADAALGQLIEALPGRRLVFTNADAKHTERILAHLGLVSHFHHVYHLEHGGFVPKPQMQAFEAMIAALKVDPARSLFFEDSPANLKPAKLLGMTTVLVGPKASGPDHDFVDFRAPSLKAFLQTHLPDLMR
jgi:putative hydrolase of the HAD superfamily